VQSRITFCQVIDEAIRVWNSLQWVVRGIFCLRDSLGFGTTHSLVIEVECQCVVTSVILGHLEAIPDTLVTILEGVVRRRGVIEEGILVCEILECEVR